MCKCPSVYKVTTFKLTSIHHKIPPLFSYLFPCCFFPTLQSWSQRVNLSLGFKQRISARQNLTYCLIVCVCTHTHTYIYIYLQDYKEKKIHKCFLHTHSKYKYTPQQTHTFVQCEFTLITHFNSKQSKLAFPSIPLPILLYLLESCSATRAHYVFKAIWHWSYCTIRGIITLFFIFFNNMVSNILSTNMIAIMTMYNHCYHSFTFKFTRF